MAEIEVSVIENVMNHVQKHLRCVSSPMMHSLG